MLFSYVPLFVELQALTLPRWPGIVHVLVGCNLPTVESVHRSLRSLRIFPLTGGFVFLSSPQFSLLNHLCCLTSLAPLRLPRRVFSLLSNKRVMQSFPALHTNHEHRQQG
jgi:hypothetical protein